MKTIQISAGRGPEECNYVVAKVLKYFMKEAEENKIKATVLNRIEGNLNATLQSATVLVQGKNLDNFLALWLGTIQWVGQSPYRKHHKRKNWFIGVYALAETPKLTLQTNEIEYQTMRSSGAGGQHVNKTSSAVRAVHKPTGVFAVATDSRSQHQNKKLATQRLQNKVAQHNLQNLQNDVQNAWNNHLSLERGNPIRVFSGSNFKPNKTSKKFKHQRAKQKQNWRKEL